MPGPELGADDYIAKPFDPDLLSARITAVSQRWATHSGDTGPKNRRAVWAARAALVSPLATGAATPSLTATNAAGYSPSATLELSVYDQVEMLDDSSEGSLRDALVDAVADDLGLLGQKKVA